MLPNRDRLTSSLRMTNAQRREEGFTLIELLIVIVILGILAAIAIFAMSGFKDSASKACNDTNTRIDKTVSAAVAAGNSTAKAEDKGNCNP